MICYLDARTHPQARFIRVQWRDIPRTGNTVTALRTLFPNYVIVTTGVAAEFWLARRGWPLLLARIYDAWQRTFIMLEDKCGHDYRVLYIGIPRLIIALPLAWRKPVVFHL